jgi:hypothetical protein
MTKEEVFQREGQRPGKIALQGLARFALNDNFCHWTRDQGPGEKGKTEK